jgi:hypothetical protein
LSAETERSGHAAHSRRRFSQFFFEWFPPVLPVITAIALFFTDRWFTEIDDEIAIVDRAVQPVRVTLQMFLQGKGQHEHPPLYDILLHGWLRITNGNQHLLRAPSIIFYVFGAWALAAAARRLGGESSRNWVFVLLTAWPFGFHFERLATWYSFCFFLVALLTLVYLRFAEQPTATNWILLVITGLALIYANYFGWAFLACLTIDYVLRNRSGAKPYLWEAAGTVGVLLLAYIPLFRVLIREIRFATGVNGVGFGTIFGLIFNMYCLFVSEAVAPWFWYLGIPAGLAILCCLVITFLINSPEGKKFLGYFFALFLLMSLAGIMEPKRDLLISPWLVMPVGVALGTYRSSSMRRVLALSLAIPAAIGWYGIFARNLYAAPRWVEPWEQVARQAALVVKGHGIVIGNNPSFFFYLTYLLNVRDLQGRFAGFLPTSIQTAGVYDAGQWLSTHRPIAGQVELIKGVHYSISATPTQDAEIWLGQHCDLREVERYVRDPGVVWKHRFAPQIDQPDWRVEVRTYACR